MPRDTLAYIAEVSRSFGPLISDRAQVPHSVVFQGLYLSDIKRSVEILRVKAKDMKGYPEFHRALLEREQEMQAFGQTLLDRVGALRMSTLVRLPSVPVDRLSC